MFEYLDSVARDVAVVAVYHALRWIYCRNKWADVSEAKSYLEPEPPAEAWELTKRVIKEMERAENLPLRSIGEATVARYTEQLANIVLRRSREELEYNPGRGKRLLNELRQIPVH